MKTRGKTKRYSLNYDRILKRKDKIIKSYESLSGYRICNLCDEPSLKGKRITLSLEYKPKGERFYRPKIIGAVCEDCYNKLLKRDFKLNKYISNRDSGDKE